MYEIEKYVNVNIGGTAILLDILTNEKTDVKRVVVAESRAIYGEGRYWSDEKLLSKISGLFRTVETRWDN